MFLNSFRWKVFLTQIVLALVLATIGTDFGELPFPGWDAPLSSIGSSTAQEQGVKAAVLAMCAAAILFVALIPIGSGQRDKRAQLYAQGVSGFSALAAGWHWLLSEAGEHVNSYLIALIPMTVLLGAVMAGSLYVTWIGVRDDRKEDARFRWPDLLGGIGLILVITVVFYIMWWLPSQLF